MTSEAILGGAIPCANCGTAASGNFCHDCGQETTLHVPSAREFLHEFIGHYVALEGKLWKTLGLLLFKPGRLTREYLAGRRRRYVNPLRLYLTLSILFFALFKYTVPTVVNFDGKPGPARAAAASGAAQQARGEAAPRSDGKWLHDFLASIDPKLGEKADRFNKLSPEEKDHNTKAAFFGYAPYAVFLLMPLFALLLKLLYLGSGRHYGEHLVFALHTNAFAFLMLGLVHVVPRGVPFVAMALGLWLVLYLPMAMRKVYGGSRKATALRWLVLMLLHGTCIGLAILGALLMAIVS